MNKKYIPDSEGYAHVLSLHEASLIQVPHNFPFMRKDKLWALGIGPDFLRDIYLSSVDPPTTLTIIPFYPSLHINPCDWILYCCNLHTGLRIPLAQTVLI